MRQSTILGHSNLKIDRIRLGCMESEFYGLSPFWEKIK